MLESIYIPSVYVYRHNTYNFIIFAKTVTIILLALIWW